jgi:hypothetical protein
VVEALRYKPEGRRIDSWGSIPDGVFGIFHLHNTSGRTMALELTQPLIEMSTRDISWAQWLSHYATNWKVAGSNTGDQFPMVSLEFFIDVILPAALWSWG